MRRTIYLTLAATLFMNSIHAQDSDKPPKRTERRGEGEGYGNRDATVLSMMGWGIGLAVGIALLCGFIKQDTATNP